MIVLSVDRRIFYVQMRFQQLKRKELFITEHATTAAEWRAKLEAAKANNSLRQGVWNSEKDGRAIMCAIGAIGKDVSSVSQCPGSIMPQWLAQAVPTLFDGMSPPDVAFNWAIDFAKALEGFEGGDVPFKVYHRWMAECVLFIAAENAGPSEAVVKDMAALHSRAAAGDMPTVEERGAARSAAWSTRSAAWSARSAAWSAAWSASYERMGADLVRILNETASAN